MREFVRDNLLFLFVCAFIIILSVLIYLFPPEESLLKSVGNMLGEIFGDVIEGFKEGMNDKRR